MSMPQPFPQSLPMVRPVVPGWLERWRHAWRQWAERRRREHRYDAVLDLSPRTLRDIGAPDWVISHAECRRELEAQRLDELHLAGRELPSRW